MKPGDSESLTVPGVGSSFRASETRPEIQKKYWIPAFAGMTATAKKPNNEWFLVLILTDCGQAPLRGLAIVKPPALPGDTYLRIYSLSH